MSCSAVMMEMLRENRFGLGMLGNTPEAFHKCDW